MPWSAPGARGTHAPPRVLRLLLLVLPVLLAPASVAPPSLLAADVYLGERGDRGGSPARGLCGSPATARCPALSFPFPVSSTATTNACAAGA